MVPLKNSAPKNIIPQIIDFVDIEKFKQIYAVRKEPFV